MTITHFGSVCDAMVWLRTQSGVAGDVPHQRLHRLAAATVEVGADRERLDQSYRMLVEAGMW